MPMTGSARQELKRVALEVFEAGLRAVDPHAAVARRLALRGEELVLKIPGGAEHRYDCRRFERIVVVGAGKATARMSEAVEEILDGRVTKGVIVVKDGHASRSEAVEVVEASHPVPDARGQAGALKILSLLEELGENDLVISLISGGGSALLPAPAAGIRLDEKQELTGLLLGAGADIGEINAVRKHISAIKGGQLARAAAPATVINLMLSDVVGDHLDVIASGPAAPDPSTFGDARRVLERYDLRDRAPASIRDRLERGARGEVAETPGPGDECFARCRSVIIGSNLIALRACLRAARDRGLDALLLSSSVEGETRDIARMHAAMAREIRATGMPVAPPACLISGGETTVTLGGAGKGGRNQEFALAAALDIAGAEGVAIFSGGTDGTDGPTDAAGAVALGDTAARARALGLDPAAALDDNDAYPLFDRLGDLVRIGPTGTNVMDVHLVLVV